MSFDDLKRKLNLFFISVSAPIDNDLKQKIKIQVTASFARQKNKKIRAVLALWRYRFSFAFSLFLIVGSLGFLQSSVRDQQLIAGEIKPTNGPIEIIRGEESFFVKDPIQVFVGDIIKTGNHGEAQISIPNEFVTIAKNKTQFRITNKKALFLDKGRLNNKALGGVEIATDRGFVKSTPGSHFDVVVSETGETEISPQKNIVQVFDLWNGKTSVSAGEVIKLYSDTQVTDTKIPDDLNLSNSQISAIMAKLAISRSKILTGVEKSIAHDNKKARSDFYSAEKTFRSIVQVLQTSREMEISRRKNLTDISVNDVYPSMETRIENPQLLAEIKSIETLFAILTENKGRIAFSSKNTGVEEFDRYVTLKNLISLGTDTQQQITKPLLQKYVVNFLRKTQNNELRIEQIASLNEEVNKLPKNEVAREFLENTQILFSPELGDILGEKIERYF